MHENERIDLLEKLYHIYRMEHPPMFSDSWRHMQAIGKDIHKYKTAQVRTRRRTKDA